MSTEGPAPSGPVPGPVGSPSTSNGQAKRGAAANESPLVAALSKTSISSTAGPDGTLYTSNAPTKRGAGAGESPLIAALSNRSVFTTASQSDRDLHSSSKVGNMQRSNSTEQGASQTKSRQGHGSNDVSVPDELVLSADKAAVRLIRAVSEKQAQAVEELLKTPGINVETRDKNGRTVLYIACGTGNLSCVQALLAYGASVTSYTPSGKSVLSTAVNNGHIEVMKTLLQQPNCDPNHQDNAGTTALMLAVEVIRPPGVALQMVQLLLGQSGAGGPPAAGVADVNVRDFNQQTALDRCCRTNPDPRVAMALTKAGAKIVEHCEYATNGHHYGTTTLMNASMSGLVNVVQWLLNDVGVDPFARTTHGVDARTFAETKGLTDIVTILEKRMSK